MDCDKASELLVRRIYRETTPDEERELIAHLSDCRSCREMDDDYRAVARILDRERPEISAVPIAGGAPGRWIGWRRFIPAAVAACILVGVVAFQGLSLQIGSWGVSLGGGTSSPDRDQIRQLVREEVGSLDNDNVRASLEHLNQVVTRQNEILAFLAGAQQRDHVLTARTFNELEQHIESLWSAESPPPSSISPAALWGRSDTDPIYRPISDFRGGIE